MVKSGSKGIAKNIPSISMLSSKSTGKEIAIAAHITRRTFPRNL
jgi:hypothetical protein